MNKKILASLMLVVLVLMSSTLNLVSAPKDIKKPKCEVILSSHSIKLPNENPTFEAWIYVTNPSKEMEREPFGDIPHGCIVLHCIKVNWLKFTHIRPDGASWWWILYPNGEVIDPEGKYYDPGFGNRIKTIVYPMEKALVYYGGWMFAQDSQKGVHRYIYTVNVEYEGQILDLVATFQFTVT